MIDPDPNAPETIAAVAYMEHKGYQASPLGFEVDEGESFFYFEVPEGLIELEVHWGDGQWWCSVTEFWTYSEMGGDWRPADYIQQRRERADTSGA